MKIQNRSLGVLAALTLIAASLSACTNVKEMIGKVESSGQLRATELTAVAVLPFAGPHGAVMADRVSYELLDRGAAVVTRKKINTVLEQRGLGQDGFGAASDRKQLADLAQALGADVLVTGTVAQLEGEETIVDQARGLPGFKVKSAALEFTRMPDAATVATARYGSQRELPMLAATYHDVARQLVEAIVVP